MAILNAGSLEFRGMVGTGGIGSGRFFLLKGNGTLGREESRAGRFLGRRDYCKLHIISHYVKALLGAAFPVYPIGKVGDDEPGSRLLVEMREVGLDMRFVETERGVPTLFSFCVLYPDSTGGNLTTEDSASGRVNAESIQAAEEVVAGLGKEGIALAAPEVPLEARLALLELASAQGLFRAASLTRAEMAEARQAGLFERVDLLALNLEEALAAAAALAGGEADSVAEARANPHVAAERAVSGIARARPSLMLSITAGKSGSWSWDGARIVYDPVISVSAEGTAGAGDAHLAGILAGLAAGLTLAEAQQLGTIVAAASVTSPHTIHPGIDGRMLRSLAGSRGYLAPRVRALLDNRNERS